MRVGLFVPCYVDAFEPEVGIATLELLERFGCTVEYPFDQTCCGQPMANTGCHAEAAATEALFVKNFSGFDYVVAPSGSCGGMIKTHYPELLAGDPAFAARARKLADKTYELVEFLHDVLKVESLPWAEFPHKVAYHGNCNALRGIHHARPSELVKPYFSKPLDLLRLVNGVELVDLARPDECCGFGGTFSVFEPAVSAKMGYDKVADQNRAGAQYVVSADSSCLMHQKGCAERLGLPLKYIHIAQVLNGAAA